MEELKELDNRYRAKKKKEGIKIIPLLLNQQQQPRTIARDDHNRYKHRQECREEDRQLQLWS